MCSRAATDRASSGAGAMTKRYTQTAFHRAVERAYAAHLPCVKNSNGGWYVQSQDGQGVYLVRFDTRASEWRRPCKANVQCIHIATAWIASQDERLEAAQFTQPAPVGVAEPMMLRRDNTG